MTKRRIWSAGVVWLGLTFLPSVWAAPLDRAALWAGTRTSPAVTLAQGERDLARARLDAVQGWQVTATGNAGLGRTPAAGEVAHDLSAGLRAVHLGSRAQEETRLALAQALRRAEWSVQRARLDEWRARTEAWNELAGAQAGLEGAALRLQTAQLNEQVVQARAAQGAATSLQLEAAGLERQRAELGQTQAAARLGNARQELLFLGFSDPELTAGEWTPLPLPPVDWPLQRTDLLEAELGAEQAAASVARARRDAQPTLGAQGQYSGGHLSVTGSLNREGQADLAASVSLHETPTAWSLGLSSTLRLDRHAARTVGVSERHLALAQATLERTGEQAARDVQARRGAAQAAAQNLELARAALTVAQKEEAVAVTRQAQGLTSELDLAQTRLQTLKAGEAVVDARRDLDRAALNLWEATGWLPPNAQP